MVGPFAVVAERLIAFDGNAAEELLDDMRYVHVGPTRRSGRGPAELTCSADNRMPTVILETGTGAILFA